MKKKNYLKGAFLTVRCPRCGEEIHPVLPTIIGRYHLDHGVNLFLEEPTVVVDSVFLRFYAKCEKCNKDMFADYELHDLKAVFDEIRGWILEEGWQMEDIRDTDSDDSLN